MKNTKSLSNFMIFAVGFLFSTISLSAQNCEVKITSPADGSQVSGNALVSGTASILARGHLWIVVHKIGFNGFYPQGNGAAQIIGKEWDVLVYFGEKGDYGKFEVLALVVDDQANQDLENWVRNAPKTNPPYQPIALPSVIDGCPIAKLKVNKTKD
jgi:hypothetical protein